MRLIPVLTSNFLLASVALAGPLPRHLDIVEKSTNTLLAGVAWNQIGGTFDYVRGTFKVPHISGQPDSSVYMWVGMDAVACPTAILRLGVRSNISASGTIYQAFYERYPDRSGPLDIDVSPGDSVEITLDRWDQLRSNATINNLSNDQTVTIENLSGYPFCGGSAGWMVEDFSEGDTSVTLANFGTVYFTDAEAGARDRGPTYGPKMATPYLDRNGLDKHSMAAVSVDNSSVIISYVWGN